MVRTCPVDFRKNSGPLKNPCSIEQTYHDGTCRFQTKTWEYQVNPPSKWQLAGLRPFIRSRNNQAVL